MRHRVVLATAGVAFGLATSSIAASPTPGRITSISDYVWACPLLNWGTGDDSGCDPIATGTAVWIHKCGISPQTRHGPFCRIEYEAGGVRKIQHIKDVGTVTPLDEDDPTVWEILARMRNSRAPTEGQ